MHHLLETQVVAVKLDRRSHIVDYVADTVAGHRFPPFAADLSMKRKRIAAIRQRRTTGTVDGSAQHRTESHMPPRPQGDPVDPRVTHSRTVILRAALEELGEVGYRAVTV